MSTPIRKSVLESKFPMFLEDAAADNHVARLLVNDLNRIHTICAGLGVVMRIISGNTVLEDQFDADTDSEPPLSAFAIGLLTNMAAELLEGVSRDIIDRAVDFEGSVN